MVEAKERKLREYFTNTVKHEFIEPSDLSGGSLFYSSCNGQKSGRSPRSFSPIRYNDTYRSKIFEGDYIT